MTRKPEVIIVGSGDEREKSEAAQIFMAAFALLMEIKDVNVRFSVATSLVAAVIKVHAGRNRKLADSMSIAADEAITGALLAYDTAGPRTPSHKRDTN